MNITISEMPKEELNQLTRRENWETASVISEIDYRDEWYQVMAGNYRPDISLPPVFLDGTIAYLIDRTQYPYYY